MNNHLIKRLKKAKRGFTLIEVIVVIGILAILSALAIPSVAGYIENSKAQTNVANAKMIYNAGEAYLASNSDKAASNLAGLLNGTVAGPQLLITGKYIASVPKTAASPATPTYYTLVDTTGVLSVTWIAETNLPAENPHGIGAAVVKGTTVCTLP